MQYTNKTWNRDVEKLAQATDKVLSLPSYLHLYFKDKELHLLGSNAWDFSLYVRTDLLIKIRRHQKTSRSNIQTKVSSLMIRNQTLALRGPEFEQFRQEAHNLILALTRSIEDQL